MIWHIVSIAITLAFLIRLGCPLAQTLILTSSIRVSNLKCLAPSVRDLAVLPRALFAHNPTIVHNLLELHKAVDILSLFKTTKQIWECCEYLSPRIAIKFLPYRSLDNSHGGNNRRRIAPRFRESRCAAHRTTLFCRLFRTTLASEIGEILWLIIFAQVSAHFSPHSLSGMD